MGRLMGFRLVVIAGKDAGRAIEVAGPDLVPIKIGRPGPDASEDIQVIGRAASSDRDLLLTGDGQVSRLHVKIEANPNGYVLTDCESTNRTTQNARLLKPWEPVALLHGDELRLGPDTVVRFELCGESRVEPPPPSPTRPRELPSRERRDDTPSSPANDKSAEPPPPPPPTRPRESPSRARRDDTPSSPANDRSVEPPPQEMWGKFVLFKTLGESLDVRVHVAIDRNRNERVVLKRVSRNRLSAKARSVLLGCAQKGRTWNHASIAEVLECGEQDDVLFATTRWIDGKSLSDLQLAYADDIDIPLAVHLTRDICAALRHGQAVERGFVWRNLNPSNVVVDREGHAVLINFGLPSARLLVGGRDQPAAPEARYLSPEQRRGKETDARSDLYSAGVILYELLGRAPVDAKQNVLKDAVGLRRDIPWDVADAANKAVAYRPERRFIHAADMEEALAAVLLKLYPRYSAEPAAWIADRLSEPIVR